MESQKSFAAALTDALVGFLGTAVIASLLQRRADGGGSYRAELSLARVAMWLLSLGLDAVDPTMPSDIGEPRMRRLETPLGPVDHVASPICYSRTESKLPRIPAHSNLAWG